MAVYTDVPLDKLTEFLRPYGLGRVLSFKGIAEGVENSNYLLQTEQNHYILTLYEKRVHEGDLPFFLGLMNHLSARGIACPTAVIPDGGAAWSRLCGRPAAIFTFLNGVSLRRPGAEHCAQLGAALGAMHVAGADFPLTRDNALSVDHWRDLLTASEARADTVKPGLCDLLHEELDVLESRWPRALPAGVIHADLFPNNVFFMEDRFSGMIDFYFACTDLYAYDAAICLNAWCFEPDGAFNITKARRLLSAYHAVRPWTADEIESLPILARGASMRFLLTRLYDWLNQVDGALVKPHDPLEYLARLQFHQKVASAKGYGMDGKVTA
jgi:homoserine kinase type II